MHRGMGGTRGARLVLVLAAAWSGAGAIVTTLPAQAAGMQHCQAIKGTIAANPGLTDAPTDQAITLAVRVTGCSRTGGSALLVATTTAAQATCASLTTALSPSSATFVWANGNISTVSLTFVSIPGSPNRLALDGEVLAGASVGDRVEGGLHVGSTFTRMLQNSAAHHKRIEVGRSKENVPLTGDNCTVADPVTSIKVTSYESLKFSATDASATSTSQTTTSVVSSSTTTTPVSSTTTTVLHTKAARPPAKKARPPARKAAIRNVDVAGNAGSSNSGLDPESVLGAICIGAAVCLAIVLLIPSRRLRRRRGSARLVR